MMLAYNQTFRKWRNELRLVLEDGVKVGDAMAVRVEIDLIIRLTACSAEISNNYRLKRIG